MNGTLPPPGAAFALRAPRPGEPLARVPLALDPPAGDAVVVALHAALLGADDALAAPSLAGYAPGHAGLGRVVATGDAASHLLDRLVLVPPFLPCGECDACRRAGGALCRRAHRLGTSGDGTLASHLVLRARFLCELPPSDETPAPDRLPLTLLAGAGLRAYDAICRLGVGPGDVLVLLGAGIEAAIATSIVVPRAAFVLAVDVEPARLERAQRRGAHSVDASGLSPDALFARLRDRVEEAQLPLAAWRVLELTGRRAGLARAAALAVPGARLALAAGSGEPLPLAPDELRRREQQILGIGEGHPDLLPELAALGQTGRLSLDDLVRRVSLEEADAALAALRTGSDPLGRAPIVQIPPG